MTTNHAVFFVDLQQNQFDPRYGIYNADTFLVQMTEALAEAQDDEAEEDILVISRDFDALALIEDELILSLPLVPLHEECPEEMPMSVADSEFEDAAQRPNPFGILVGLKTDKLT